MTAFETIFLVARREIRERLRSKTFLVSTALLLLLVGVSTIANGMIETTKTYGVVSTMNTPQLERALQQTAAPFDATVRLRVAPLAVARQELAAKKTDAVLDVEHDRLLFREGVNKKLAAIADTAVRIVRGHVPAKAELAVTTLEPAKEQPGNAETLVAVIGSLLVLLALAVYGQWVVVGVVEEKSNRVVELILAAARPRHLLAGKLIGIGLLGLTQLVLVAGLAAALLAVGVFDAPRVLGWSMALVIPWFALGFALYAVLLAAAGALASSQQDASTAAQPIMLILSAAYFASYITIAADAESTAASALTVFPLTAPLVLPARAALVGVPLWQHALAIGLVLASIYGLVRLAGRIYTHGLLASSPHFTLGSAWKLIH